MSDPRSLREQFDWLLDQPERDRADFLAQQTPERRQQLLALLAADAQPSTAFVAQAHAELQSLLIDAPAPEHGNDEQDAWLEKQIGPYRLTHWLGRGGTASVYIGERNDGKFSQQVAVKILRQSLHTDFERKLFQREQQALSALDHANVARLLDGGLTSDGQPYLVMELVRGKTLLEHCQAKRLAMRARVQLFAQICDGVQAAHRALIVHRDIKPSNIVVSDQGQAKLLDFGVAKILRIEDDAIQTQTFAPLTPAYAAPEQFDGSAITTATDVYGLGMVLHELLTGVRRNRGDTTRASEILRKQKLQDSIETVRFLQGDIDNILRKALAAEAKERYASAGEMALDIQRFLSGQPVGAHPPSVWYRTKKFVLRNQGAVLLASLSLLGIVASGVYAMRQAIEARAQAAQAQLQAKRAEATKAFLVRLFEVSEAGVARTEIPSTDMLLREGGQRVLDSLADAPSVRIELLNVIGGVQQSLGLAADAKLLAAAAVAQADQTLSVADPQWLKAHVAHAQVAIDEKRFLPAIAELQAAIAQSDGKNPDAQVQLQALKTLALAQAMADQNAPARASAMQVKALALRDYGAESIQVFDALELATEVAYQANDLPDLALNSEQLLTQAQLRFGPIHARTLEAKIARLQYLVAALKTDAAEAMAQSAAADLERIYSQPNQTYVTVLTALAAVQFQNGKIDAAASTMERINKLYQGPLRGRPGRDSLLTNLASIRLRQFRNDEALKLATEAITEAKASYGAQHSEVALILRLRGQILARLNRIDEAATELRRARAIFVAVDGAQSTQAQKIDLNLADLLLRQGQGREALAQLRTLLVELAKRVPETHRDVIEARLWEVRALLMVQDFPAALLSAERIAPDLRAAGASVQYLLPIALQALGDAQQGMGNQAAAKQAWTEALTLRRAEIPSSEKAIGELIMRLDKR